MKKLEDMIYCDFLVLIDKIEEVIIWVGVGVLLFLTEFIAVNACFFFFFFQMEVIFKHHL